MTTKINFLAWIIEVTFKLDDDQKPYFLKLVGVTTVAANQLSPVLPLPLRMTLFRLLTHVVAPLFYICAAEKEKLKKVSLRQMLCLPQNNIQPIVA